MSELVHLRSIYTAENNDEMYNDIQNDTITYPFPNFGGAANKVW